MRPPPPVVASDRPRAEGSSRWVTVCQARAFLDQIAGLNELPPCPALADGLHNMRALEAIVAAADTDGKAVKVS